jgi:hypothetical protein
MNYIDDDTFLKSELIPFIQAMISDYIIEELSYVETVDDLDEIEYMNCPEDLRDNILDNVNDFILECIDDYDVITNISKDDYEEKIDSIIEDVFEDVKKNEIQFRRDDFDRLDYFEEEDYD